MTVIVCIDGLAKRAQIFCAVNTSEPFSGDALHTPIAQSVSVDNTCEICCNAKFVSNMSLPWVLFRYLLDSASQRYLPLDQRVFCICDQGQMDSAMETKIWGVTLTAPERMAHRFVRGNSRV